MPAALNRRPETVFKGQSVRLDMPDPEEINQLDVRYNTKAKDENGNLQITVFFRNGKTHRFRNQDALIYDAIIRKTRPQP